MYCKNGRLPSHTSSSWLDTAVRMSSAHLEGWREGGRHEEGRKQMGRGREDGEKERGGASQLVLWELEIRGGHAWSCSAPPTIIHCTCTGLPFRLHGLVHQSLNQLFAPHLVSQHLSISVNPFSEYGCLHSTRANTGDRYSGAEELRQKERKHNTVYHSSYINL